MTDRHYRPTPPVHSMALPTVPLPRGMAYVPADKSDIRITFQRWHRMNPVVDSGRKPSAK